MKEIVGSVAAILLVWAGTVGIGLVGFETIIGASHASPASWHLQPYEFAGRP